MLVEILKAYDLSTGDKKFKHTYGSKREMTIGQNLLLAHIDDPEMIRTTTRINSILIRGNLIEVDTKNTKYVLKLLPFTDCKLDPAKLAIGLKEYKPPEYPNDY